MCRKGEGKLPALTAYCLSWWRAGCAAFVKNE